MAESLESAVFLCPKCGQINHLHSKGDRFFCDCGYEAVYDKYGNLVDREGGIRTVTELDKAQRAYIEDLQRSSDGAMFEDTISQEFIDEDHNLVESKDVELKAYPDAFEMNGEKLSFDDIEAIAINQRNLLLIHKRGVPGHFQYRGPVFFNALKYLYVYRAAKGSADGFL